jgi:hypothetical protein
MAQGNQYSAFIKANNFIQQCTDLAVSWLHYWKLPAPGYGGVPRVPTATAFKQFRDFVPGSKGLKAGDLVVFNPGGVDKIAGAGHVGIFEGWKNGTLRVLGADQGNPKNTGTTPNVMNFHLSDLAGYVDTGKLAFQQLNPFQQTVARSGIPGHTALFQQAGAKYGIDPNLLVSIAWLESHGGNNRGAKLLGVEGGTPSRNWKSQIFGAAKTLTQLGYQPGNPASLYRALESYGATKNGPNPEYVSKLNDVFKSFTGNTLASEAAGPGNNPFTIGILSGLSHVQPAGGWWKLISGQDAFQTGLKTGQNLTSGIPNPLDVPGAIGALPGEAVSAVKSWIEGPFQGKHLWKTLVVITAILVLIGVTVSLAKSESPPIVPVPV